MREDTTEHFLSRTVMVPNQHHSPLAEGCGFERSAATVVFLIHSLYLTAVLKKCSVPTLKLSREGDQHLPTFVWQWIASDLPRSALPDLRWSKATLMLVGLGRIELPTHAPKARVLPLNYRPIYYNNVSLLACNFL